MTAWPRMRVLVAYSCSSPVGMYYCICFHMYLPVFMCTCITQKCRQSSCVVAVIGVRLQEVRDSRDTKVPQRLAKAYRLHARAKVPSPADLAASVQTLLRAGAGWRTAARQSRLVDRTCVRMHGQFMTVCAS